MTTFIILAAVMAAPLAAVPTATAITAGFSSAAVAASGRTDVKATNVALRNARRMTLKFISI